MSKIEIGKTYVTRDGSRVKFKSVEDNPNPNTSMPDGATTTSEQVYVAEVLGQYYTSVTRYKMDGTPLYNTPGMFLVDLVDEAGDQDSAKAMGSTGYKKKSAPGEGVAVLEQDSDVTLRDDDPVHPNAEDEEEVEDDPPIKLLPVLNLQVGFSYTTRDGEVTLITRKETNNFYGLVGDTLVVFNRLGYAMGWPSKYDLIGVATDEDAIEKAMQASIKHKSNPTKLKVQVGHTYEDAKGERWLIEKKVGDRFVSNHNTWSSDGMVSVHGQAGPWDLVKDLGKVLTPSPSPSPMPSEEGETPFNEGLVQAVLDGKTVQWRRSEREQWEDLRNRSFAIRMLMLPGTPYQFRLKDQPLPRFCAIYKDGRISISYERYESVPDAGWGVVTVLRILLDPETMQVVSYQHLAPRPKGAMLS